jgi:hypothetical protein
VREVRALLDLLRGNEAAVKDISSQCRKLLRTSASLKILDPAHGEEELIELAAAEYDKLSLPLRKPQTLNPQPGILNSKP